MGRSAIVVGSGLAGLSCAEELVSHGVDVTVLDGSDTLGGRTSSWIEDGMAVESGLHKYLGIYRALPQLLERAEVDLDNLLTWTDELAYHIPGGETACFVAAPYRHPFGTLASAVSNTNFLPLVDQVKLGAMAAAGIAKYATNPLALDEFSIAEYANSFGVSPETISNVISTSTQAILFLPADEFSAYAALAPIAEGLKRGLTMRIGAFNGGMTDIMMKPIARRITKLGGTVRLGCRVDGLMCEAGQVTGVRAGEELLTADFVALAVPLAAAQELVKSLAQDFAWFESMLNLPSMSAVTIQFELDEPFFDKDRTNFSPTSLCCFAEQSRTTFRETRGRLSAIVYPPEQFIHSSADQILAKVLDDADQLQLPLRRHIQRFRVVKHPTDFYAMRPGTERLRPTQATPVGGLALAGDYTKQPFSASMEGAVLSGLQAAEVVLSTI